MPRKVKLHLLSVLHVTLGFQRTPQGMPKRTSRRIPKESPSPDVPKRGQGQAEGIIKEWDGLPTTKTPLEEPDYEVTPFKKLILIAMSRKFISQSVCVTTLTS